jgi:D-hexose-6-phosphate mutarotase
LTIGKILTIELTTNNQSNQAMTIGQALHTYFKVADVSKTHIFGLENKPYLDKTDGFKRKTQSGAVTIGSEVDRVYLQTADDVVIDDGQRKIVIKKQGSHSTVVWNPWKEAAEKMGDLGPDGYLKMLCVESANAVDDTVVVSAGESYRLLVTYELEAV